MKEIYEIRKAELVPYMEEACRQLGIAPARLVDTESGPKGIELEDISHKKYRRILAKAHELEEAARM